MSDLTHQPRHGDWSYECIHCGEQDVPITEECPEHPDRQREEEDEEKVIADTEQLQHRVDKLITRLQHISADLYQTNFRKRLTYPLGKVRELLEEADRIIEEYDNEEEAMSDKQSTMSDSGDRQREDEDDDVGLMDLAKRAAECDDDDGEGGVSREIAERFLDGESIVSIQSDDPSALKGSFEQAIRDHCELSDSKIEWPVCHYCEPEGKTEPIMESEQAVTIHQYHLEELSDEEDGVCEWTYDQTHYKFDSSCGEGWQFQNGPEQLSDDWDFCPGCGDRIKIITDEGGEYRSFEMGDVIYVKQKDTYHLVREPSVEFPVIGEDEEGRTWREDGITYDIEKVGEFTPNDDALERVPEWVNGELCLHEHHGILFAKEPQKSHQDQVGCYQEDGTRWSIQEASLERTGIVVESFHQIAEVSDGNIDK